MFVVDSSLVLKGEADPRGARQEVHHRFGEESRLRTRTRARPA